MDKHKAQEMAIRSKTNSNSKEKAGEYDQEGGPKHKKAKGIKCPKCGK